MIDHSKEKAEKIKAFRKLMSKWLTMQETSEKANHLLSRNPHVKGVPGRGRGPGSQWTPGSGR